MNTVYNALHNWSKWVEEGHFISFLVEGVRYYEHVLARDFAHYEYDWPETVNSLLTSGPHTPADLEITRGFNSKNFTNHVWQSIFGIRGQCYIYVESPEDIHRHGLPKQPKPSATLRETSHFNEWLSPFMEPSFVTEHFQMRPTNIFMSFEAYNPTMVNIRDLRLNIFVNKMITERIGIEEAGELTASHPRFRETLDKLYRRVIPQRPITLQPISMPAVAPAEE